MPGDPAAVRPGPITPRLIVDDVLDRLLVLIVDGHVEPDQPLGIDALAREFGGSSAVSRCAATGSRRPWTRASSRS